MYQIIVSYNRVNMSSNKEMNFKRRNRNYFKPRWEIEKEEAERIAEEKRKEQERGLENTEENFPSLVSRKHVAPTWNGRKFAELASEWKSIDEEEKTVKPEVKEQIVSGSEFMLPKFNNIHRFHEPEDDIRHYEEESTDKDGWVQVERKVYVPKNKKTVLDYTEEDFDDETKDNDDTVWGADDREEHETCWDERRY